VTGRPEALLARVKKKSAPAARQAEDLLGAAAGVGKTYAMLEAARDERATGRDVIVGLRRDAPARETRRRCWPGSRPCRCGTWIPRTTLREFDLDGALARVPR